MARIIVTPDDQSDIVLLDEHVYPVHLDNRLSSLQVAERLAWAVSDAEAAERQARVRERYPERVPEQYPELPVPVADPAADDFEPVHA
jgi:hypothetical protein